MRTEPSPAYARGGFAVGGRLFVACMKLALPSPTLPHPSPCWPLHAEEGFAHTVQVVVYTRVGLGAWTPLFQVTECGVEGRHTLRAETCTELASSVELAIALASDPVLGTTPQRHRAEHARSRHPRA